MKKLSGNNKIEVVSEAIIVAIGATAMAGLLYYADTRYPVLGSLNINRQDVIMMGSSALGFCLLWVILHHWFFMPYIKLFEKREKLTVGAEDDLHSMEAEISEMLEKYEAKTLEARSASQKTKAEAILKAKAEANEKIEKAKAAALDSVAKAKKELQERRSQLQNDAQKEAEVLSAQMVSKVLEGKALN